MSEPRPQDDDAVAPARRGHRCCSRSTSATRRPSSGCSTATGSTEQFRVGTEPGAHGRRARRAAARVRRPRVARRDRPLARRCRSSCASTRRSPSAGPGVELLVLGPGRLDRACRSATTTRARSGPTGSRTRSPRASGTARRRSSSTSAPRRTSTSSRPPGEYVGGVLAPGIEISMDALFARAARLPKVPFVAPERVIGKTTVAGAAVRARLRLRRARSTRSSTGSATSSARPSAPVVAHGRPRRADRPHSQHDHASRRPGADAARGVCRTRSVGTPEPGV